MTRSYQSAPLVAALFLLLAAATAFDPVAGLAGRYSEHFRNALVSGESFWSDDVVEIVPIDASHAYLRFALNFYNGHECNLDGVARADGDALVYTEPAPVAGEPPCVLRVRRDGKDLVWDDDGSCKFDCGARGSFLNGSLSLRSRRPITYMTRLKGSDTYREALERWRQSGK